MPLAECLGLIQLRGETVRTHDGPRRSGMGRIVTDGHTYVGQWELRGGHWRECWYTHAPSPITD